MDSIKVGELIKKMRKEKKLTQLQLADILGVSDKTVSKWERGLGLPDTGYIADVADALGVGLSSLLSGDENTHDTDGGNMRNICFYTCPVCGNVIAALSTAEVVCCGKKLISENVSAPDKTHLPSVETFENEYYIRFNHEMTKEHFIDFAAYVSYDRVLLLKLYPEGPAEVRFAKTHGGRLIYRCNEHGVFEISL